MGFESFGMFIGFELSVIESWLCGRWTKPTVLECVDHSPGFLGLAWTLGWALELDSGCVEASPGTAVVGFFNRLVPCSMLLLTCLLILAANAFGW